MRGPVVAVLDRGGKTNRREHDADRKPHRLYLPGRW